MKTPLKLNPILIKAGRWFACLTLLTGLAATQLPAAEATVFSEDFESFSDAAISIDDYADADPTNPFYILNDDTPQGSTNGPGVQVQNWLVRSGTKALLLRSGTAIYLNLSNTLSGSKYQIDFWLYSVKEGAANRGWYAQFVGEGADINANDFIAYRSSQATTRIIQYYDGIAGAGAWVNTVEHAVNAWQHHRLVVDPNTQKMTVYLDDMDTPVITDADLARCETPLFTQIRFFHQGDSADDGYVAVDDITVTVENSINLATTFTDGFESYPARTSPEDDADPQGPWITVETDGTGTGRQLAPVKVQVVQNDGTITARSGTKCLKIEGGQRAGVSLAWGVPPQSDVEITWWARVPESFVTVGTEANYLRMSLYGAENYDCAAGDNALLGYGVRSATVGDSTSLTYYTSAWFDTLADYTPDTWEQYRLTTHTSQGRYTIVKNPNSASPVMVVDRSSFIGSATTWAPVFMAGWSSSNGTNHPPVYIDDIEIRSVVSNPDPLPTPYTVEFQPTGTSRFTNSTILHVGNITGKPVVDPRDNSTILFAVDAAPAGIYRANKVASGNWEIDPTPIVSGLDRPSGLAIAEDGTLFWTHDYSMAVGRLKTPWESSAPEILINNFGEAGDDDPIDLVIAPATFNGSLGKPGMLVIADRGSDVDANNALNLADPNATELNQVNNTFLVPPTPNGLGNADLNAITALPVSGEVVTLSQDGWITAVDANGMTRYIIADLLWPLGSTPAGACIAADPKAPNRLWLADDTLNEIWSITSDGVIGTDVKEVAFPLNTVRTDYAIDFHDPGMSFAPDGSFLVISDANTVSGGGRLIILHNEAISAGPFPITEYSRTATGFTLTWEATAGTKYRVERATALSPSNFQDVSGELTGSSFTDTNVPSASVFYRVVTAQ